MKNTKAPIFIVREIVNEDHTDYPEKSLEIETGMYGSIWIENAADIILLKKAIDEYIGSKPSPLVSDYLRGYQPTDQPGKGVIMRTSSDIQSDLADMDDLSVSEIAEAMTALGYRAHFSESGSHGWLLKPISC